MGDGRLVMFPITSRLSLVLDHRPQHPRMPRAIVDGLEQLIAGICGDLATCFFVLRRPNFDDERAAWRQHCRRFGHNPIEDGKAAGTAVERLFGFKFRYASFQRGNIRTRNVWRVGNHEIESLFGLHGPQQISFAKLDAGIDTVADSIASCDRQCAGADIDGDHAGVFQVIGERNAQVSRADSKIENGGSAMVLASAGIENDVSRCRAGDEHARFNSNVSEKNSFWPTR